MQAEAEGPEEQPAADEETEDAARRRSRRDTVEAYDPEEFPPSGVEPLVGDDAASPQEAEEDTASPKEAEEEENDVESLGEAKSPDNAVEEAAGRAWAKRQRRWPEEALGTDLGEVHIDPEADAYENPLGEPYF